jgi:hypothetical protein
MGFLTTMIMNMVMTTMIMNKATTIMNKVTITRVAPYYYCKHKHDAEDDMNDMVAIVTIDTNTMKTITIITRTLTMTMITKT